MQFSPPLLLFICREKIVLLFMVLPLTCIDAMNEIFFYHHDKKYFPVFFQPMTENSLKYDPLKIAFIMAHRAGTYLMLSAGRPGRKGRKSKGYVCFRIDTKQKYLQPLLHSRIHYGYSFAFFLKYPDEHYKSYR